MNLLLTRAATVNTRPGSDEVDHRPGGGVAESHHGRESYAELQFPADSLEQMNLAEVSAPPQEAGGRSADDLNKEVRSTLSASGLDSYYRTLLGESSADIEFLQQTESLPAGREAETFATGGCRGLALDEVGRIWDLRDKLQADWEKTRLEARAAESMTAASAELGSCALRFGLEGITGPGDLDAAWTKDATNSKAILAVEAECIPRWQRADAIALAEAEKSFYAAHSDALEGQVNRFGGLYEASTVDVVFAEAVRKEVSASTSER